MSISVNVTRWTDREMFDEYKKVLANVANWDCDDVELNIATHGRNDLDDLTKKTLGPLCGHLDCKDGDSARLPRMMTRIFDYAIGEGFTHVAVMDDDAYLRWPDQLVGICKSASDAGSHAFGPITPYWAFTKHGGGKKYQLIDMKDQPWTTMGMQIYSTEFLIETEDLWRPMLHELTWRSDFPFFMLNYLRGHRSLEIVTPGYEHKASGGSTNKVFDRYWHRSQLVSVSTDYDIIWPMLMRAKELYVPSDERWTHVTTGYRRIHESTFRWLKRKLKSDDPEYHDAICHPKSVEDAKSFWEVNANAKDMFDN